MCFCFLCFVFMCSFFFLHLQICMKQIMAWEFVDLFEITTHSHTIIVIIIWLVCYRVGSKRRKKKTTTVIMYQLAKTMATMLFLELLFTLFPLAIDCFTVFYVCVCVNQSSPLIPQKSNRFDAFKVARRLHYAFDIDILTAACTNAYVLCVKTCKEKVSTQCNFYKWLFFRRKII